MALNQCPACSRVYADVGLKFCLDDGTELVSTTPESEPEPTAVMSESENNMPETIEASPPVIAADEPKISSPVAAPGAPTRSLVPLLITIAVLLVIGVVVLIAYAVLPAGENIFSYFLTRIARRLPMLLLALGGIIFAIMRWRLHPRASLMTVIALGISLVDMVVYTLILYWLPSIVEPMRMSTSASRFFYSVVYFIEDIVMAVTILLLVAAAFTNRKARPGVNAKV
ncbi:MAG TPA: hypothetical protein VFX97_15680 [Pyrinomonadaceae bacterium]|nr:hypothetical protein [Pyrinomonadaceae bacterium]